MSWALHHVARAATHRQGAPAPVVILLHGWGMYHGHLFEMTHHLDRRLDVVSPRAPVRMGPGTYRWFNFVRTPSDGPNIDHDEEVSSLAELIRFIEQVIEERGVPGVWLIGHSQGGTMALSVCTRRPDLVLGCANVNGRLLDKAWNATQGRPLLSGKPFFNGHGLRNPIVPLHLGRRTCARIEELGASIQTREYAIGHEINDEILADVSDWLSAQLDGQLKTSPDHLIDQAETQG